MERSNRDIEVEYADLMWKQHDLDRGIEEQPTPKSYGRDLRTTHYRHGSRC